jgi:hypothetical protein
MAYKITIAKRGRNVGQTIIETLDSTSCSVAHEVAVSTGKIISSTPLNHDDDVPVNETINLQ